MRRVAYATQEYCGLGHAVRGVALVEAASRAHVELRAFGPPVPGSPDGYEGSADWRARVGAWAPDLLLGDIQWVGLDALRVALGVPSWLLLRWMPMGHLLPRGPWSVEGWERRISIEPAADDLAGITHRIAPIIDVSPLPIPADGTELRAGYNAWWRGAWFGYRDRVRWYTEGSPERQARIDVGGEMTRNGADVLMGMLA